MADTLDADYAAWRRQQGRISRQTPDQQAMTHGGARPAPRPEERVAAPFRFMGERYESPFGTIPKSNAEFSESVSQLALPQGPGDLALGVAAGPLGRPLGAIGRAALGAAGLGVEADEAKAGGGGALEMAKRALDELGFYSKALEEAKGAKMKEGSVQQWKNVLQKQGVKPAELDATGFTALPIDQKLNRDDVINFFTENRMKLGESRLNDSGVDAARAARDQAYEARDRAYATYSDFVERNSPMSAETAQEAQRLYDVHNDLAERAREAHNASWRANDTAPKFEQYSLPGGANYSENLLTLPPVKEPRFGVATADGEQFGDPRYRSMQEAQFAAGRLNRSANLPAEQGYRAGEFGTVDAAPLFTSSHWEEPNVLAHTRTKERLGPNGERVLHIDEIQSDWGQAGARKGWKPSEAEIKAAEAASDAAKAAYIQIRDQTLRDAGLPTWKEFHEANKHLPVDPFHRAEEEWQTISHEAIMRSPEARAAREANVAAHRRVGALAEASGSPAKVNPAPWVTDEGQWTDLALKRALIQAEREGYDAVALTPGVEQAKRYDLGDRVGRIEYVPDGGYLTVKRPDGGLLHNDQVPPEKLAGIIGKENAERLLAARGQNDWGIEANILEPSDMTWGGKGMERYYDKVVPSRLDKLARSLDPEARIESMPAGRRLGIDHGDPTKNEPISIYDMESDRNLPVQIVREFPHDQEPAARALLDAGHYPMGGQIPQLPMLRLTDRMREQIRQGLPYFVAPPVVAGGVLSTMQEPAPMANEFARGGPVRDQREQQRLQDIERASPSEEMLGDSAYRYYMPGYDRLMANRPIGGTDAYRLTPVRKFEVGGLAERGYEAQAGGGSGGGIDWGGLYSPIGDSFWNGWDNTVQSWESDLAQGIDPSTGNYFSTDAAMASGPGMAGFLNYSPYSQSLPEVQPYEGASPVAPEAPAMADLSGGLMGGGAAYPGAAAEAMQPRDVQIEAPYDLPAGLPSELTQSALGNPFDLMDKPDLPANLMDPNSGTRRDNLSGVNFDFGFTTPTGAPVVEQPMSYERAAVSTPYGYAGTPEFSEAMSVLGPMGMSTPVPAEVGTVFGQHMGYGFDPRSAYAPGMGPTTYQDWGLPPEQAPAPEEIAGPVDTSMPPGLVGNASSSKASYTSDLIGPFSPQGVRNLAALNQSEVENIAAGFARDLARQRGISIDEAMPDARAMAYQHVTEVVQNRSAAFGPIGFGGQRYNPTIEQVINQRSQFSGIPGTHGDDLYPGRVADLPASPEAIAATERVLGGIAAGRRDFPNALDFMNPDASSRRNMDQWGREFVRDPSTQRVAASTGPAHYVGNVNDRAVPAYETLPPVASAPNSLPSSIAARPASRGTGRRADAGMGIGDYVAMAMGITPAMAQPVTPEGLPAPRDPSTIPELDPFATEKEFFGGIGRSISSGIRSLTGTVGDHTAPPAAAAPTPYGFTPDIFTQDTLPNSQFGRAFGNDMIAGVRDRGVMAGSPDRAPAPDSTAVAAAQPAPAPEVAPLPDPIEVANVPMPPERPPGLGAQEDEQDPAARERAVTASADMPSGNRFNVDPLTGRMYDAVTGDRIFNPTYVSRTIDGIAGVTPLGVVNSPLALMGGLTGYPMSLGQLMALGRPGAPTDAYGAGSPDKLGNYRSYGEGAEPTRSIASGGGYPLSAPSGGGGGALSTVAAASLPDSLGRQYLGVDEDPRTYGMRAMRRYYGTT